MKKLQIIIMLFFSFVFCFCSESNINENELEPGLNFYFLKDTSITASQSMNLKLEDFKLADAPYITYKDMEYYKWSDHSFVIDTNKVKIIYNKCENNMSVFGIPFVVTVDENRVYLGAFWFAYSSLAPILPHINGPMFGYDEIS